MNIIQMADLMTREAASFAVEANEQIKKDQHMNRYRGPEIDRDAVDAILVAFVNRVMARQGLDLGLYASDFPRHRARHQTLQESKCPT